LPPNDYKVIESLANNKTIQIKQLALRSNIEFFRKGLYDKVRFPSALKSPIQIIQTGSKEKTIELAEKMKEKGIYTKPIFSPTVPQGKECVRICLHSFNTKEEIDFLKTIIV